nr:MAG TPA: D-MONELLIN CHAIN A, D-MONELLIN CHAIN/BETA, ALL-D PROTEIN, DE NOVO.8A [Caudoviricetes sp.]
MGGHSHLVELRDRLLSSKNFRKSISENYKT